MSKCIKFLKLRLKIKILLIIIFFLTGIFRFIILVLPFRYIARYMGQEKCQRKIIIDENTYKLLYKLKWAIKAISKNTPWKSLCMVQALTVQTILNIRRIPSTIFLGIAKEDKQRLQAHAWLTCGDVMVTGEEMREEFTAITWFTSCGNRRSRDE